jgi:hypothetical protein
VNHPFLIGEEDWEEREQKGNWEKEERALLCVE